MALYAFPHSDALVGLLTGSLPLELQVLEAEHAVEAAETVWRMRARDLEAAPSAHALRQARWAGLAPKDATDELERLQAHLRVERAL